MGNQPRYNIQSAIPGGVVGGAKSQIAASAAKLGQELGGLAYDIATEVGIPKAIEAGKVAGSDLSWKPKASIGKIASAYEAAALQANDDKIESTLKISAARIADELGKKPGGHAEFDSRYNAATNDLMGAVSPERRKAFIAKRDELKALAKAQVLQANTEIQMDGMRASYNAQLNDLYGQQSAAAARHDDAALATINTKIAETKWYQMGQPVRNAGQPNEERVSVEEMKTAMFKPDGTVNENYDPAASGITFKTAPLESLAKVFTTAEAADEAFQYASLVGPVDHVDNPVEYVMQTLDNPKLQQLPFDQQEKIRAALLSRLKVRNKTGNSEARDIEKQSKEDGNAEYVRLQEKGWMGTLSFEEVNQYRRTYAGILPEKATALYGVLNSQGIASDPNAVAAIQSLVSDGRITEARDAMRTMQVSQSLHPKDFEILSNDISKAISEYAKSPAKSSFIAPVFDQLESRLGAILRPSAKIPTSIDMLQVQSSNARTLVDALRNEFNKQALQDPNLLRSPSDAKKQAQDLVNGMIETMVIPGLSTADDIDIDGASQGPARLGALSQLVGAEPEAVMEMYPFFDGLYFDRGSFEATLDDRKKNGGMSIVEAGKFMEYADKVEGFLKQHTQYGEVEKSFLDRRAKAIEEYVQKQEKARNEFMGPPMEPPTGPPSPYYPGTTIPIISVVDNAGVSQ